MLFRTFDGDLQLALHTPNETPRERAVFLPIEEANGRLLRAPRASASPWAG
jgi:arabinan endo-1,5-alpha-L-arabinosidase